MGNVVLHRHPAALTGYAHPNHGSIMATMICKICARTFWEWQERLKRLDQKNNHLEAHHTTRRQDVSETVRDREDDLLL